MIEVSRRSLITGLAAFIAAPAIVREGSLMPVKQMLIVPQVETVEWIGTYIVEWRPAPAESEWRWVPAPNEALKKLMRTPAPWEAAT